MVATLDDTPLRSLCEMWLSLIEKSREHRQRQFGETAELCHRFYTQSHDFIYEKNGKGIATKDVPAPCFKMTVNKVAELVQLFGPHLYHKDPIRTVKPRRVPLPQEAYGLLYQDPMQAQAVFMSQQSQQQKDKVATDLLSAVMNYTPREFGLKQESMLAIDEGLIAGRGFLIHEMAKNPSGNPGLILPQHYFKSWRHCYLDPDADSVKDALWFALECTAPVWEVEREYQLPPGSLKRHARGESANQQGMVNGSSEGQSERDKGQTSDQITYFKVWTKCGMGQRSPDSLFGTPDQNRDLPQMRDVLEQFGDFCFLVIARGIPYPLNLPPDVQNAPIDVESGDPAAGANRDDLLNRVRWPIPFYKDGGWPFSELDLHPVPGDLWPMAHLRPAMGEMQFLDWVMSWLAGRIQFTGRALVALANQIDESTQAKIENGPDLTVVRIPVMSKTLKELIDVFQFPEVNADVWRIIELVSEMFDKRTGLSDLVYGMAGKQMRSASEAQMRDQAVSTRPDDMADKVEEWQTKVARNEAMMLRFRTPAQSIAQIVREPYGADPTTGQVQMGPFSTLWTQLISVPLDYNNEPGMEQVAREYEYTLVSGSARKPNLEREQENMNTAAQTYLPLFQGYYNMTGDSNPLNAFTRAWAEAHLIDNPDVLMLPQMQMQPAPVDPNQQPVEQGAA